MRDRKAVARYAGLTGSPDESGAKRREQGLARAGNARVRRGMVQPPAGAPPPRPPISAESHSFSAVFNQSLIGVILKRHSLIRRCNGTV
jgi:hypothetical protein